MSAQLKLRKNLQTRGPLCIGLDPDRARLPEVCRGDLALFLREIIAATAELASAYKVNSAFFESLGHEGFALLAEVRAAIPESALFILDAKRGDIRNTNEHYAKSAFEVFAADAVTVHPYLGLQMLEPFFAYRDRLTYILCATSEGTSLQELAVNDAHGSLPLWLWVARAVADKHKEQLDQTGQGQCGLVVGATRPGSLEKVRAAAPSVPLLVPGVGAQGGEIPSQPALVNASRSILYASGGADFAQAAADAARTLRAACLGSVSESPSKQAAGLAAESPRKS
jgi:orotidine-5'-phosphate decarboxylase